MRTYLLVAWLFVGLSGLIYHYGPGKQHAKLDQVDQHLETARTQEEDHQWAAAIETLDNALAELPTDQTDLARRLRLEKAKAQMMAQQLPEAHRALKSLLTELTDESETTDPPPDEQLVVETREALANSQYYMTWLMRLEGAKRDQWEPEIEAARQNFRLLAERAEQAGQDKPAERHREDLESAVRLARLDLSELQGLPLPSQ